MTIKIMRQIQNDIRDLYFSGMILTISYEQIWNYFEGKICKEISQL